MWPHQFASATVGSLLTLPPSHVLSPLLPSCCSPSSPSCLNMVSHPISALIRQPRYVPFERLVTVVPTWCTSHSFGGVLATQPCLSGQLVSSPTAPCFIPSSSPLLVCCLDRAYTGMCLRHWPSLCIALGHLVSMRAWCMDLSSLLVSIF